MIKTFSQAVKFLERYIPTPEKKHPGELGLRRMEYLMNLLGNPQLKYPTIHVGGTSGKGSTATIIASILATKYKVGLHTSPHLVKITERIKIFGQDDPGSFLREFDPGSDISEDEFIGLVNYIKPFVDKVEKSNLGLPSYFEIVTAMAFLYFYQQKVDIAVIEVGMGGRFDATNVIRPEVAVLTNVGLDHTEILGDTIEKIAEDKAGIIKPGILVVSGVKQTSVIQIIREKCKEESAKLSLLIPSPSGSARQFLHHPRSPSATSEVFPWLAFSYRIKQIDSNGSVFDYKGIKSLKNLKLKLLGEHQVENAALAIRAVELLSSRPSEARGGISRKCELKQVERFFTAFRMTASDIRRGLNSAYIPGRLEIIGRNPLVILDGAHNPDKVKALADSVKKIFPKKRITTIIAIKNDKDAKEMLTQLLEVSYKVIFTKFELTADIGIITSYDPNKLLGIGRTIAKDKSMSVTADAKKAVDQAIKSAKSSDLILVTGSLYLVGEIKKNFKFQNPNFK
ncbi:bifunctional folylpolyglutamate synthase/dihydrofolate synthase [Candidatus Gottesmanbacteria bacterium]|nr:bifunctional folylpolyglutamate synthase/dihydrofolate synthase [Candidatus Gottesmanbacteria bacterium]